LSVIWHDESSLNKVGDGVRAVPRREFVDY
jgi:hypothetical protein